MTRALFVGGTVDNAELDLDVQGRQPPMHYPENSGAGRPRYRLHHVGLRDGEVAYAVYGAPEMADADIVRISDERDYPRRFSAEPQSVEPGLRLH